MVLQSARSVAVAIAIGTMLLGAAVGAGASPALAVQEIRWTTLLPQLPPLKDPIGHLTVDQRLDLETILWVRTMSEEDKKSDNMISTVEAAKVYEKRFNQDGINIDKLIADYAVFDAKRLKRERLVNDKLNGKRIRMPGYLLPLTFSEEGETDFLLVPYVGACVHVPPPPPNQVVIIKLKKKFKITDLFTPVFVTGLMKTQNSKTSVELIDGVQDVQVGYHIVEASAEIYDDQQPDSPYTGPSIPNAHSISQ
ncbi:MAG: DUF3299 domain-containing protein [Pseudomonadota bacterium]